MAGQARHPFRKAQGTPPSGRACPTLLGSERKQRPWRNVPPEAPPPASRAQCPPQLLGQSQGASIGSRFPGTQPGLSSPLQEEPQLRGRDPAAPGDKRSAFFPHEKGTCVPRGGKGAGKAQAGLHAPLLGVPTVPWKGQVGLQGEHSTEPREARPALPAA